ncbi:class I SAM-dependent methyltransferase [Chitinophaga niabensis]|uniref:class I SAM-dependent methyltransferase n=1 Tax=Chitinophaga niabensis TaxID=536979 RepID=UPI0031B9F19E
MKKIAFFILRILEILLAPFLWLFILWCKVIRRVGSKHAPVSEKLFMKEGIFPLTDHYYEPLINPAKYLNPALRENRNLTGIDLNDQGQLNLLQRFNYNEELLSFPEKKRNELEYAYDNDSFKSGDAEYLFSMVRHFKPNRIIEIGSGNSTLLVAAAIKRNSQESGDYKCAHICIEPYEQPWLEKLDAEIIRKRVEEIDLDFFGTLKENDILFIDSSHIIRPQGDVLFEYLTLLPTLNKGVIVHVHDIFTPNDYLHEWIFTRHLFWNEQYLLEAFLSFNSKFEVIGAVNYLSHHYKEAFSEKCPAFAREQNREPGSFWMRRV